MKYIILTVSAITMLFSSGCNNDISSDTETGQFAPLLKVPPTSVSENMNSLMDSSTISTGPHNYTNQNSAAGYGLNPAHGKPGHRCDIPVGAPLNSTPSTVSMNNQPANTNQLQTTVPASIGTANGLNPEHGKPGHRCDIAVGAPLNSKPTPVSTNNQSAITTGSRTQQSNQVTPGLPSTVSSVELNPAHGKPGHRCDIAVGAPLNDKPTQ